MLVYNIQDKKWPNRNGSGVGESVCSVAHVVVAHAEKNVELGRSVRLLLASGSRVFFNALGATPLAH